MDCVGLRWSPLTSPVLLGFPAPVLPAYSRESVVAEKFQAMVMLGIANSRMQDFYDLWVKRRFNHVHFNTEVFGSSSGRRGDQLGGFSRLPCNSVEWVVYIEGQKRDKWVARKKPRLASH
jgi:hypothetical protein